MSELSASAQSCLAENADPQRLMALFSNPEMAGPEEIEVLTQCLEDETLLRLFLTVLIGLTEPLSEETSMCVRDGFVGIDIRSILAGGMEGNEEAAMMGSMVSFLLTLACLNEGEWAAAAPALDMGPEDQQSFQCVMEELGGPGEVASLLEPDAGPPIAFIGAAMKCGLQMEGGWAPLERRRP